MAWNSFKLASYSKFGFSRQDLDGNELAKSICLARKARGREVLFPRVVIFDFLKLSRRIEYSVVGGRGGGVLCNIHSGSSESYYC